METILMLLKTDLGIKHDKRDEYFRVLISSTISQLKRKGIISKGDGDLDYTLLVADLAAWSYRNRQENMPMAENLKQRIRDRIVGNRANANQ